jgi:hypothetical protein
MYGPMNVKMSLGSLSRTIVLCSFMQQAHMHSTGRLEAEPFQCIIRTSKMTSPFS